jgi:DNA polymerase I-like protein with 3'-5' exonuclease and polymerase domains
LSHLLKIRGISPTYTYAVPVPQPQNAQPKAALIKTHAPALQEKIESWSGAVLLLGKVAINAAFPKRGYRKTVGSWVTDKVFATLDPGKVMGDPFQFNNFNWQLDRFQNYDVPPLHVPELKYRIVYTVEDLEAFLTIFKESRRVAIDIETIGENNFDHTTAKISAIGLSDGDHTVIIHRELVYHPGVRAALTRFLEVGMHDDLHLYPQILAHNGKFDFKFLSTHLGLPYRVDIDTLLLHYTKNEQGAEDIKTTGASRDTAGGHGLKVLTRLYLGWDDYAKGVKYNAETVEEWQDLYKYLAYDVVGVVQLSNSPLMWEKQDDRQIRLMHNYGPVSALFSDIESRGILLDVKSAEALSHELSLTAAEKTRLMQESSGQPDLVPSENESVQKVVYGGQPWSLPIQKSKKTGNTTLDVDALDTLQKKVADGTDEHRFLSYLLDYRKAAKIKATYADGLLRATDAFGRVATSFKIHGTVTGRVSSANPNLQNIPSPKNPVGRRVRQLFLPNPGHKWVKIDGSQMELRVLAYLSQSETLKEIFRSGGDIHKVTMMEAVLPVVMRQDREAVQLAAKVASVGYDEAKTLLGKFLEGYPDLPKDSELYEAFRVFAKTINFGIIYGMGAATLAESLGVSTKVAQGFLDNLLKTHPGIGTYMNKQEYMAFDVGEIITPLGFRRQFGFTPKNRQVYTAIRNHAYNSGIQGTAGLLTLYAGVEIWKWLLEKGWTTPRRTITPNLDLVETKLTVHDEWDYSVDERVMDEFIITAPRIFEETPVKFLPGLDFPFAADAKVGDSWGTVH